MAWARIVGGGQPADAELAVLRLGLPSAAREYALAKHLPLELLITAMTLPEAKALRRACASRGEANGGVPIYLPGDPQKRPGSAVLWGRRDEVEGLLATLGEAEEAGTLPVALERALAALEPTRTLQMGKARWDLGQRTHVMGVVNVTPDSFFDGGAFLEPARAIAHGLELAASGADLLDIGGESTRPGSAPTGVEEELRRVLPVVEGLRRVTSVPLSVDTSKAPVAAAALAAGAVLVNDVSGLSDPRMGEVVARAGASLCLMHMKGVPATMQADPTYDDVIEEVLVELEAARLRARNHGIPPESLWVDPGIGFGKTLGHNLFLLRRLNELRVLGCPILVGTSRKSFLGKLTGGKPAHERLAATLGSIAANAVLGGADMVRAHDVAEVRDVLSVVDAIRQARDGGALFQSRKGAQH